MGAPQSQEPPAQLRERYDQIGLVMAQNRSLRAILRGRKHEPGMQQGLNAGVYVPPTAEDRQQWDQEREAMIAEEAVKLGRDPETTTYEDILAAWDRRRQERGTGQQGCSPVGLTGSRSYGR